MTMPGRRRSVIFFSALGITVTALAVALQIGWIADWRNGFLFALGVIFSMLIIAGVVLNTLFLIREIRRNEQHDAFLNAVTHELKTPVASLRLYLETLQSRDVEPEKQREFYRIMHADTDRLLGTIEQVLETSRLASALPRAGRSPLNMQELVRECLELARVRHHLSESALQYRPVLNDADAVTVNGYANELRSAVSNLLDNAIKYSVGDVKVVVELARMDKRRVALRVHDEGMGIPRNELKRIFGRFYRIPGVMGQRVKGTGLGLFIVRAVARRHGGRAYAESEGQGKGSTFTMELLSEAI
jgi:two-component system, OmpR family, sensor histidine kinase SenX3